jgi:hypothetical protein
VPAMRFLSSACLRVGVQLQDPGADRKHHATPIATTVHVIQIGEAPIVVIEVPNSPRVVGTTQRTYLRRAIGGDGKPTCVPYYAHEMLASEIDRGAAEASVEVASTNSRTEKFMWRVDFP